MSANLREHFDRAVGDDPGADLGEMARAAIAHGGRIRRRRKQMAVAGVAAGVVLVLAVVAGVHHRSPVTRSASPAAVASATAPAVVPAMMLVAASDCSVQPVANDATDVVIFPGDADGHVTGQMVSRLRSDLTDDPRVAALSFETHAQIYQRFRKQWPNNPDFVASVHPNDLPEFFRLRLRDASQYTSFRTQYAATTYVMLIEGRVCRTSAPVGGIQ